jgi:hypothetical protein
MTRVALLCGTAAILAACTPDARDTTDSVAGAVAEPGTISLNEVVGTWNVRAVPESGSDTVTTTFVLEAKADTSGWTITYPGRPAIPVRVWAQGDSVVTEAGPYESVRRAGVRVTTHGVFRLRGDTLAGTTVARYAIAGADSILRLRATGIRAR